MPSCDQDFLLAGHWGSHWRCQGSNLRQLYVTLSAVALAQSWYLPPLWIHLPPQASSPTTGGDLLKLSLIMSPLHRACLPDHRGLAHLRRNRSLCPGPAAPKQATLTLCSPALGSLPQCPLTRNDTSGQPSHVSPPLDNDVCWPNICPFCPSTRAPVHPPNLANRRETELIETH